MADINMLTQKVIDREQAEADNKLATYEEKLVEKTAKEKQEADADFEQKKLNANQRLNRQAEVRRNNTRLKKRDRILAAKQAVVDEYIADIKAGFQSLDAELTLDFIKQILTQFEKSEQLEIQLGELTHQILGDDVQIDIPIASQKIPNQAGFIIKEEMIEYNYLFDNLVDEKVGSLQQILIKQIFEQE